MELCRKEVDSPKDETMMVNLNRNLYIKCKDKVFSEGNTFDEPFYIHLKYRDVRIEMPVDEFKDFASMIEEARKAIDD